MSTKGLPLSFESLDKDVSLYVAATADFGATLPERWLFAIGLFAAGLGSLLATLIGGVNGVLIIQIALVIEIIGLVSALFLQIRRNWSSFRRAHATFAQELDGDYARFQQLLESLSRHPRQDLERMQRYVARRRDTMGDRLSLITGGMERLGFLPVLVALYIQFKDWEFGDWDALASVNVVGGLLLWALLLVYLGSWYLIRLRARLDVYEHLLDEAHWAQSTT